MDFTPTQVLPRSAVVAIRICEIQREEDDGKSPRDRDRDIIAAPELHYPSLPPGFVLAKVTRSLRGSNFGWGPRSGSELPENRRVRATILPSSIAAGPALFHALFPQLRFTKARSDSANGLDRIPFALGFSSSLLLLASETHRLGRRLDSRESVSFHSIEPHV